MRWRRIRVRVRSSAQFEEQGSTGALDAVPITDATADEKVDKWNKNTLVWFPHTLVLDELLPATLSVSSAATELLPLLAATAVVQPACGSDPAWLHLDATVCVAATDFEPASGPHPAWLERCIQFVGGLDQRCQRVAVALAWVRGVVTHALDL